jgi:hypothetical protein
MAPPLLARGERRRQRQERHHRDVLEQHHAEGQAPVGAIEFGALGELLNDEHRGAHRHHAAEHDAMRPGHPEHVRDERDHRRGAQHLQAAETEHLAAQRHHARPREFQAQREQQEDHAEFGQQVRGGGFGEHSGGVRPEGQAHGHVAEDRGQPEAARQGDHEHRRGEQDDDESQGRVEHSPES